LILLDTHVLLWFVAGSGRMGENALRRLQTAWDRGAVSVSTFSFWEVALLHAKGRLDLAISPCALHRRLRADGLRTVAVDAEIAFRAAELANEGFHADPADRIITATALVGGFRLATADGRITSWAGRSGLLPTLDPAS
jgi:PIN domain nuclease of toxin-antitoxin system